MRLADYLQGLEQQLIVARVRRETIPRVAQMHQRTNQFNLTTVRLTEAELGAMIAEDSQHLALLGRVADRFGDHGIVIAATARIDGDSADILTLLMSCRVIGREVERAFLGALLAELERRGVRTVAGTYKPTPKNEQVRNFYPSVGFRQMSADAERTVWRWAVGDSRAAYSEFVTVQWGNLMDAPTHVNGMAYPQLAAIFEDVFQYTGPLGRSTSPDEVSRWDSLQHIALVRSLEETFDIQLSMDEMMEMRTVGDIENVLRRHGV